jgi:hypothetical protein
MDWRRLTLTDPDAERPDPAGRCHARALGGDRGGGGVRSSSGGERHRRREAGACGGKTENGLVGASARTHGRWGWEGDLDASVGI